MLNHRCSSTADSLFPKYSLNKPATRTYNRPGGAAASIISTGICQYVRSHPHRRTFPPKGPSGHNILVKTTWYLGATMAAWITFATFTIPSNWAWRIPSLLQMVPAIITTATVLILPESPRWLIANSQSDKTKAILTQYHAEGDENDELVCLEFQEVKQVIEADLLQMRSLDAPCFGLGVIVDGCC